MKIQLEEIKEIYPSYRLLWVYCTALGETRYLSHLEAYATYHMATATHIFTTLESAQEFANAWVASGNHPVPIREMRVTRIGDVSPNEVAKGDFYIFSDLNYALRTDYLADRSWHTFGKRGYI